MMKAFLRALCLLMFFSLRLSAQEAVEPSWNAILQLHGVSGETLGAAPVTDRTVVTFSGDSIRMRCGDWSSAVSRHDVASFSHVGGVVSDFRVAVVSGVDCVPVEGASVVVRHDWNGWFYEEIQMTGGDGVALFRDIPAGIYDIFVNDPAGSWPSSWWQEIFHTFNDAFHVSVETGGIILSVKNPFDLEADADGSSIPVFYDLNGLPVDPSALSTGIYIYRYPSGISGRILIP